MRKDDYGENLYEVATRPEFISFDNFRYYAIFAGGKKFLSSELENYYLWPLYIYIFTSDTVNYINALRIIESYSLLFCKVNIYCFDL